MKRILQKLLCCVLALAMVLPMLPALEVRAAEGTAWTGGPFPKDGSYYLAEDITLTKEVQISSGQKVTLDLNGHCITVAPGIRGFYLNNGQMTVRDTGIGGTVQGSGENFEGRGGLFYVKGSTSLLTLESGTITGGCATDRGGNVYVESGRFDMTGGVISEGYAGARGGNIGSTGILNLSGGLITGGVSDDLGGNIVSTGAGCYVNVSGTARILDGVSDGGGNIALIYSNLNMSGGEIVGGTAKNYGADIHTYGSATTGCTVRISGGKIGPERDVNRSSVYLTGQEGTGVVLEISGGEIAGRINCDKTQSITLSGAPQVSHLKLSAGLRVTPVNLLPEAKIRIETAPEDLIFSGLVTNVASYADCFLPYTAGYGVSVVNNRLTLVAACVCGCGKAPEDISWQSLADFPGGTLPGGHYFVPQGGMTLTDELSVAANTEVTLDLRGNTLTAAEAKRVFYLYGTLNLMDSAGGGVVTGGRATRGGNIYVAGGTYNQYSGTLLGGVADNSLGTTTTNGRGGNIFASSGEIHLLGGTVAEGKTLDGSGFGGNICLTGLKAHLYIGGDAVVRDGSGKVGGNVYVMYSHITISGGTISGGVASKGDGTSIYTNGTSSGGASTFTMSGGRIIGGDVYLSGSIGAAEDKYPDYRTVVNISGGEIEKIRAAASTFTLTGKPVLEALTLAKETLITESAMTQGASVTFRATEGPISLPYAMTTDQVAYYHASEAGFAAGILEGVLTYGAGCICGCGDLAEAVSWQTWNGEAITKNGHYRLEKSMTLSDVLTIPAGITAAIDLQGNTLTAAEGKRTIRVDGTLTVTDSATGGTITGGYLETGSGGNIYLAGTGVFNLRGGTIADGYAGENGGNLYINSGAVFNLYDGTVTGGSSGNRGGNIYMATGEIYMYGGTISDGVTASRGGNIFTSSGKIYLSGGTLSGGTTTGSSSSTYGGNLMATSASGEIHISGNVHIYKGTAGTGSAICLMYSNLYMSGGTVHDGSITSTETSGGTYSRLYFSGGTVNGTVTCSGDMTDGISTLLSVTGGTFTNTFKINDATHVIFSGAPEFANLTLAEGVKITPVRLDPSVRIPLTAVGTFTTELSDAEQVANCFVPSKGVIVIRDNALSMDVTEKTGKSGNITWTYTTAGTLILTGNGEMNNYYYYSSSLSNVPWKNYQTKIKKVIISEGITSIGNYAFSNCTSLETVEIASSVLTIGSNAFNGCSKLTTVELPEKLTSIGTNAFNGAGLTEITLPDTVTTLSGGAFRDCASLTEITLGTGLTSIGSNTFTGCSALETVNYRGTEEQWANVSVGGSNTPLTNANQNFDHASGGITRDKLTWTLNSQGLLTLSGSGRMPGFYQTGRGRPWEDYADQITAVRVEGYTSVGNWAFYNLDNLTTVTLAASVTEIEENAFRDCDKLETIDLSGVTKLGDNALRNCDSLTAVTLGTQLRSVGRYAFYDCDSLLSVKIPASLTRIGHKAFADCDNLETITVAEGNPNYASYNGVLTNAAGTKLLRVPGGYTGEFTVPEGVTTIGESALAGCGKLTAVNVGDNVETIDPAAFYGSSITEVKLGAKVNSIASDAFTDCQELTGFVLSPENAAYAADAFGVLYTAGMQTLVCFPGGLTGNYTVAENAATIATGAAAWHQNLTDLTLPASVSAIGSYAFQGSRLVTLDFTSGTKTVSTGAFELSALEKVNYTGTEQTWKDMSVASYNQPLQNAERNIRTGGKCGDTISWDLSPEGVLTLSGTGALPVYVQGKAPWYTDCSGITATQIEEGITGLSKNAFYGCNGVQTLTLPASLTEIGENAFAACTSITDVTCAVTKYQWQQVKVGAGNDIFATTNMHFVTAPMTGIAVTKLPQKQTYYQGDALELTGLEVTCFYADGMTELTEAYTVTADLTAAGQVEVTITLGELSATFPVQVLPAGVCGEAIRWTLTEGKLELTGTGAMAMYSAEAPAPWAAYADTITELVIDPAVTEFGSYAFASCTGLQQIAVGEQVISIGENCFPAAATIAYAGSRTTWAAIQGSEAIPAYVNITYGRVDLTGIEITAMPEKVAYLQNEALDTKGMEVTALYDDGTTQIVTGFDASADMTATGQVEVTVTYESKTATFSILISYGGYLENGLYWQYLDGSLVIGYLAAEENPGSGAMADFTQEIPAPWAAHAAEIANLVVAEGVTAIGTNAFASCTGLTVVTLPVTLTEIRENAFFGCEALTEVNYAGEEKAWADLAIAETGNEPLLKVKPQYKVLKGDLNEDGAINFLDLGAMQAHLSGKSLTTNTAAGDLNGDGAINFLDLGALQAHLSGKAPIEQ